MSQQEIPYAVQLKNVNKSFGAVRANQDINLQVKPGNIHGIVGENGAGKSTLMSILYGLYQPDSGKICVGDKTVKIHDSQDAIKSGIGMVHQHFMLVQNFTVLENIILGAEGGWLLAKSFGKAKKKLKAISEEFGLEVPLDQPIESLAVGMQQRTEILKALYRGVNILILDEPTGVLTPQETEQLFNILKALKARGTTVIIITHKLKEIMSITDHVSVMRQGKMVAHLQTSQTSTDELAQLMVGRKVLFNIDKQESNPSDVLLDVKHLSFQDEQGINRVDDVSFNVRAGEVVGIAGVSGNGQSELLETLAGIKTLSKGSIHLNHTTIDSEHVKNPAQMRKLGLGHIPEDRHKMGLINKFSTKEAFILGFHRNKQYNHQLFTNKQSIKQDCQEKMNNWDVRPPNPELKTANFSGGNQQKLVIAREVEQDPDILLVGQPTRGVDIGAIEFIHKRIIEMRDKGKAVLLVSVELDEIMSLSDRILVMMDGKIVGEVNAKEANEKMLGLMMANAFNKELS